MILMKADYFMGVGMKKIFCETFLFQNLFSNIFFFFKKKRKRIFICMKTREFVILLCLFFAINCIVYYTIYYTIYYTSYQVRLLIINDIDYQILLNFGSN